MILNLIKQKQIFSLTLPKKIKGQYWITDIDECGKSRNLMSVEAIQGNWVLKSNKYATVLNPENASVDNTVIKASSFFTLKIANSDERVILYAEDVDKSREIYHKIIALNPASFKLGRKEDNNIRYNNRFISSNHAKLSYDGKNWIIMDIGSTNGTYVNGYRIDSMNLNAGDLIYIMGLKIIIGDNYFAINNPDNLVSINSQSLVGYRHQNIEPANNEIVLPPKDYYYRSPRFYREVEHKEIKIDPPPQRQKMDTVPLALMLGPSMTMGLTSVSTGLISLNNVLSNGGSVTQALPTLMMSGSMLLGTVLWPILTKKYEKKQRIKNEKKRQEKYLAYLDEVRDEIKRECKNQSDILRANLVSLEECANRIAEVKTNLWERVIGQSDFLKLRLGLGTIDLDADVKYREKTFSLDDDNLQDAMLSLGTEPKILENVPISFSLIDDNIVGVIGNYINTVNMMKSLILQMISLHSYDELKIMLIADEDDLDEWKFVKFIPHFWNDEKSIRFFATNVDEVKNLSVFIDKNIVSRGASFEKNNNELAPYYVILSVSKKLSEKSDSLLQLVKSKTNRGASVVFMAEALRELPKETKLVISVNGENSRMFDKNDTTGNEVIFNADSVNEAALNTLAEDIANIELDLTSQRYSLPNMITFLEMFNVSKIEHLNPLTRWKENNPTISLQTPIGVDSTGELFNLDLHEKFHGPHGLVAGMTGSGKSEFIITYILSLAVNYHPDEVAFILIDYKGGGLAGAFEDPEKGIKLPHLAGTITNLDGAAVKRSLISIQSELRRRQAIFNEARKISNEGTMDIYKYQQLYRDKVVFEPVPHLFIISDEFAELKSQQPEFMEQLISTARIGRSLGVHLILATQKPNGVVNEQIWSNSKFRVCLKVQEKADSEDMIKCPDAAELSQTGRFYLQVGFNELFELGQSAWCGADYAPTETVEKTLDSSIQIVDNIGRVLMNVKPGKKKITTGSKIKQIVAIVKYLSDLATEEKISVRPLWLKPIPEFIFVEDIEKKYNYKDSGFLLNPVIGEYDDPFNQKQGVLTVPFTAEGNCLIYGSTGNGKTTFLTTLCYSLIKNHSADELNLYIIDFGSETLKVFEKAPQVGGVVCSADEEKTINLFKLLQEEIDKRKKIFSAFGGDYVSYCKSSGKKLPNIVVLLNNISGFTEQYEDLQEIFSLLTRDGMKYGVYFAVTASSTNAVRYKTAQNFKTMLTMQLNDATDYSFVVGKTEGLIPSKYKGRGLVGMGRVYEFQTAYCKDVDDRQEYLRAYCADLRKNAKVFARKIPVLPDVVDYEYMKEYITDSSEIPVGVAKESLQILTLNIRNKVVYPVMAQDISQTLLFANEFAKIVSDTSRTVVVDTDQKLSLTETDNMSIVTGEYEAFVQNLFEDMVTRNNTYKDSQMDVGSLEQFEEKVYVIVGIKKLFDLLTDDKKDKLKTLIEKGESIYKLHFVMVDSLKNLNTFTYEPWYKRHISGSDGVWIGYGVADQYALKITKITKDLYEEIKDDYGYLFARNRLTLVKLLSSAVEEDWVG